LSGRWKYRDDARWVRSSASGVPDTRLPAKERVLGIKIADETTLDPAEAAKGADLVVICTPMGAYEAVARAIAPVLKPGAIVTEVGSVKQPAIDALRPYLPKHVHLVPGHPVAGTENSGPESGFAELFEGRWFITTPPPGTDEAAVEKVVELWRRTGSRIARMDAQHHDHVLAITSHVPHVIAYAIVGTATGTSTGISRSLPSTVASRTSAAGGRATITSSTTCARANSRRLSMFPRTSYPQQ